MGAPSTIARRFLLLSILGALSCVPLARAGPSGDTERARPVALEAYAVYDRVVQAKFLTSETSLVLIRRLTATQVGPSDVPFARSFFEENRFFDGRLPGPLLGDFLEQSRRPAALEPRFQFGVRYRLVSSFDQGGPEEARGKALVPARLGHAFGPTLMLEFSPVAFSPRRDQALVYAGQYRADGTGAGLLVWLVRDTQKWEIADTEVVWTVREDGRP
ncbi:hypothetical protein [Candidatus Nitrospira bockiana]